MRHTIRFTLRDQISISVLYKIIYEYRIRSADNVDGWLWIDVELKKEEVKEFLMEYGWAVSSITDLEQDSPEGSYLINHD